MELINATRMTVGYTMGLEPSGRELLVVAIKGTFKLPAPGDANVGLADEQLPLVMADTFFGEPGLSAPRMEIDYAPRKHACDVLLVGSAHSPGGRPASRVQVGMKVGPLVKSFNAVGNRHWQVTALTLNVSDIEPFVQMPIDYGHAFGGVDNSTEGKESAYMRNPAGRGYARTTKTSWLDGRPLPNTEALNEQVSDPGGDYTPASFGVIGRHWQPRIGYAGTYDDAWLADHFPFLPPDFDERYFQAAPADQQLPIPKAPLEVALLNLTPDGRRSFMLPYFEAPVHVFPKNGEREDHIAQLDTIVFEPDAERFTMTWRLTRPLKRNMFEIAQVLVGRKGREWWQQREQVAFPIPVVMVPMEKPEEADA
jgi:hypothetical protein